MTKMLTLDEMMTALLETDRRLYQQHVPALRAVGQAVADDLGEALDIETGVADYHDGGLMVGFAPKSAAQPVPDVLSKYDVEGDWVVREWLPAAGNAPPHGIGLWAPTCDAIEKGAEISVDSAVSDNVDDNGSVRLHRIERSELNTIIAALRFYQGKGQGDPANRSVEIHELAVGDDDDVSLDASAIDDLCEKLNCEGVAVGNGA
jgi:hypothetical protein